MDAQTKATMLQEGGKLVGDFIRLLMGRSMRMKARAFTADEPPETESPQSKESSPSAVSWKPEQPTQPAPVTTSANNKVVRKGIDAVRLAWQEDLALGEAWLVEGHLKNKCIGCGGDVECCWKHSDNLVRVANETLSMTTDPFWQNLNALATEIRSKSLPDDVRAGTYAAEYPGLAVRMSEFRVPLQTKAMQRAKKSPTLEELKAMAASEAEKEVEKQWQAQQTAVPDTPRLKHISREKYIEMLKELRKTHPYPEYSAGDLHRILRERGIAEPAEEAEEEEEEPKENED